MRPASPAICVASALALSACAVAPPSGPTVMALPAQGKSFEAFQTDDAVCRNFAMQQTGGMSAGQAATNSAVGSAVVGTALGAGLGAALGSVGGAVGAGAAIGGATGLIAGSAIGANNAQAAGGNMQARYDGAYTQCMYAKGNTVQAPPVAYAAYPAPGYGYYPPPPYYGYYGYAPSVVIGGGWGWGGWRGGGWRGGWHRW
jgi:hypothetical protein